MSDTPMSTDKMPTAAELLKIADEFESRFPAANRAVRVRCGADWMYQLRKASEVADPAALIPPFDRICGLPIAQDDTLRREIAVIEYADGSQEWCHIRGGSYRVPAKVSPPSS